MRKKGLLKHVLWGTGLAFIIYSLFILKIPKTFDRVILMQQYSIKYGILILGIILVLLFLDLIFSSNSLLQRKKSFFLNLFVLMIALFFCAFMLEIFLEVTAAPGCKQGDPIYDHSYIPNCVSTFKTGEWDTAVKINSQGLRDDEILPKQEDELRILMLGDSFTWGYGVEKEETFSDLLEQHLKKGGMNANVINAGATSYSPTLEYLFLKNKGIEYKPDVVILNLDLSDLQDDYIREQKAQYDASGELIAVYNPDKDGFIYNFRKRIQITNLINGIFVGIDKMMAPPTEINYSFMHDVAYDRYGITRDQPLENEEEHWNRTFSYINKIKALCDENNITFVLSIYPYGHQISTEEWKVGRHNSGLLDDQVYSDRAEKIIQQYAQENDLIFISMFSGFRKAEAASAPLYFTYDGHFNQHGHQVAAEILQAELIQQGIVPVATVEVKQGKIFIVPSLETEDGK
jgi:lysophospholipase L1-like esterase